MALQLQVGCMFQIHILSCLPSGVKLLSSKLKSGKLLDTGDGEDETSLPIPSGRKSFMEESLPPPWASESIVSGAQNASPIEFLSVQF